MYTNPSARSWRNNYSVDPAILPFHTALSEYGPTPLRALPQWFADRYRVAQVLIKDESYRFGLPAYKILGASWGCYRAVAKHLNLPPTIPLAEIRTAAEHARLRFYTATDGNWGRAVARMGALLGATAIIYVPKVMVESTKRKIVQEGARVIVSDGDYDLAVKEAERDSRESAGMLIEDTAWPGYEDIPQVSLGMILCPNAETTSGSLTAILP